MRLIPTASKEKLPEGFSYPLGAEAISEVFDTVPHLENATIWFSWRDEYWASSWRKKIESRGSVTLLEVGASPLSGEPTALSSRHFHMITIATSLVSSELVLGRRAVAQWERSAK